MLRAAYCQCFHKKYSELELSIAVFPKYIFGGDPQPSFSYVDLSTLFWYHDHELYEVTHEGPFSGE